jgi:hypothetical protein
MAPLTGVNQPPQQVPQAFARDPALNDFFQRLLRVVFQLWRAVESGESGAGGGSESSGGDTYITNVTNEGDTIIEELAPSVPGALIGAVLEDLADLESALSTLNASLLAQIGAIHQRIDNMATTPRSMALNVLINGTSDASPDILYQQNNGTGLIGMASAFNGSTNSETLSVYILAPSGSAATVDPVWVEDIEAGASVILSGLLGQVIPAGGSIVAFASTADVIRVTISGSNVV